MPNHVQLICKFDAFDLRVLNCRRGLETRNSRRAETKQPPEFGSTDQQKENRDSGRGDRGHWQGRHPDADVRIRRSEYVDASNQGGGGKSRRRGYDLP